MAVEVSYIWDIVMQIENRIWSIRWNSMQWGTGVVDTRRGYTNSKMWVLGKIVVGVQW